MTETNTFDIIIIGGSYAGLSAAMALGRSLKNVLIIDSGNPCNRYTPHSHNFITQDGVAPAQIAIQAKQQVLKYDTVKFLDGLAINGAKTNKSFTIQTKSGETFFAKKLVFATGIKDIFPAIEGFEACWGKTVIHCPYCHGYEFKKRKTAIIGNEERAMHLAALVNNLTNKITVITCGNPHINEQQLTQLQNHYVNVIQKEIKEIEHLNGAISAIIFQDGEKEDFDAAYAVIPFEQHCHIPSLLGCGLTDTGLIKTDMFQKTTIPGIYACGDNTSPMRSVACAIAAGNITGAMINNELRMEIF